MINMNVYSRPLGIYLKFLDLVEKAGFISPYDTVRRILHSGRLEKKVEGSLD